MVKITEAMRRKWFAHYMEDAIISIQGFDKRTSWSEIQNELARVYRIVHSMAAPKCRKNHPVWIKPLDAFVRRQ